MSRRNTTPCRHLNYHSSLPSLHLDGYLVPISNTVSQRLPRWHSFLRNHSKHRPHHIHSSHHLQRAGTNSYGNPQRTTGSHSTVSQSFSTSLSTRATAPAQSITSFPNQRPSQTHHSRANTRSEGDNDHYKHVSQACNTTHSSFLPSARHR